MPARTQDQPISRPYGSRGLPRQRSARKQQLSGISPSVPTNTKRRFTRRSSALSSSLASATKAGASRRITSNIHARTSPARIYRFVWRRFERRPNTRSGLRSSASVRKWSLRRLRPYLGAPTGGSHRVVRNMTSARPATAAARTCRSFGSRAGWWDCPADRAARVGADS